MVSGVEDHQYLWRWSEGEREEGRREKERSEGEREEGRREKERREGEKEGGKEGGRQRRREGGRERRKEGGEMSCLLIPLLMLTLSKHLKPRWKRTEEGRDAKRQVGEKGDKYRK